MKAKRHRANSRLMHAVFGAICALAVTAGLLGPLQTASAGLPPRPTPITPTNTPSPSSTATPPTSTPSPSPTATPPTSTSSPEPTSIPPTSTPTPQPTSTPPPNTPTPKPEEPAGAWIELRVHQPGGDLWPAKQELWTVVQWQDLLGRWHDVEGWRGTLDQAAEDVGSMVWWVAQKDLSTGPFRWRVYRGQDGEFLAGSEPFTLPDAVGTILTIKVLLAP